MNNCEAQDQSFNIPTVNPLHREYTQKIPSSLFNKENVNDECDPPKQIPENHRKVNHRCIHNVGPPPRPFKKARYAWEIKNYDYTVKKMTQSANHSTVTDTSMTSSATVTTQSVSSEAEEKADFEKPEPAHVDNSSYEVEVAQVCDSGAKVMQEGKTPDLLHMIGPPHHQGGFVGPFNPTSYHAHYGAIMGSAPNQTPIHLSERLSNFHAQISPDPDARLIRWHTRQLCRSIFDNTVNRMLENMGFSPVTERSQALHPLLVFSLSDDEEREAEEAHQRTLETQALTAALHQKGFLPPPYHYDPLESATTSDYDSSEDDSELGEGGPDDMSSEQLPLPTPPEGLEEEAYLSFNTQHHPSLAHVVHKPLPYISSDVPLFPLNQTLTESCDRNCSHAQRFCDYHNICDANDSIISSYNENHKANRHSDSLPNVQLMDGVSPELSSKKEFRDDCIARCQSLECEKGQSHNGNGIGEKDDNENCMTVSKQETLIEGKVERVLDDHPSEIALDTSNVSKARESDNNDSYFIRNAIQMALKQQGLGFQRA